MQELPLTNTLIDHPEAYRLAVLVGRRYIYVAAREMQDQSPSVLACVPADITAPTMAKAMQEAVYANPMLLMPFGQVTVMIDARDYFWLPAEAADSAEDAAAAMGFDVGGDRTVLTAAGDDINVAAMVVEAPLVNFIRRTFPEARISHPAAELVRRVARHRADKSTPAIHVIAGQENMTVAVFDATGLALCGTYRPTGVDSQVYYTIAAARTAGVDPQEAEISVSGDPETRNNLIIKLRQFANHVMSAILPSAAFPGCADLANAPYPVLICE